MIKILHSIKAGIPVLTVNLRLSRHLHGRYASMMLDEGLSTWPTPEILPFAAWLKSSREDIWPESAVISEVQAAALWDTIVSDDRDISERELLIPQGVVKSAFDAYRLMKEYRLKLPEDDLYLTDETSALKRWSVIYEDRLERLGFVDPSAMTAEFVKTIGDGAIKAPSEIILAGFDEVSPSLDMLIEAIEEQDGRVIFWPERPISLEGGINVSAQEEKVHIYPCDNEKDEVIKAARWARSVYFPGKNIGIIVPDMSRYRSAIVQEFSAELDPASLLPGSSRSDIFNISLGSALADEALVSCALDLLSIDDRRLGLERISPLLLSPYLSPSTEETAQLAMLDALIKKKGRTSISLTELRLLGGNGPFKLPLFLPRLENWLKVLRENPFSALPSEWAELFNKLLDEVGWPGGGISLDSREYQALLAWNSLLSSFASLDDITGKISRHAALGKLLKIARERVFQPESAESPIEVMGLLESSGIGFDYIWILGAHENALPSEPSPNPFLPIELQRKSRLPRSSFEREHLFAAGMLRRLIKSSSVAIVSHPIQTEGREVRLSPLIAGIADLSVDNFGASHRYRDLVRDRASLEALPLEKDLPVSADELEKIRGGTAILKNQSDCPFRAFAVHRLFSEDVARPEPGLNAMDRGSLVHKAMELFWEKVKDLECLRLLMEEGELPELIGEVIEEAASKAGPGRPVGELHFNMEKERLALLMEEWLAVEAKRIDFTAGGQETEKTFYVGGLTLSGRLDRIDVIEGNKELLIDYKTGKADPKDWLGDRPKEPQMMLYASSGQYEGVAFARLKRGECRFAGFSREGELLPGVKALEPGKLEGVEDWAALMEDWQTKVERLAEDFMAGKAAVDPRDIGTQLSACRYCEQKGLCRIFENAGADYEL